MRRINLKKVMLANAIFSATFGMIMLVLNSYITELMGLKISWLLPLIGVGLLGFAATVAYQATRQVISAMQVKSIVIQDLVWVVASIVVLLTDIGELSYSGKVLIALIAIAVADFALLQWIGLRRRS